MTDRTTDLINPTRPLAPGDTVRVTDGPLQGRWGELYKQMESGDWILSLREVPALRFLGITFRAWQPPRPALLPESDFQRYDFRDRSPVWRWTLWR